MPASVPAPLRESPLPGAVPRLEVPGWRERFGLAAGVTWRGAGARGFDLGLATAEPVGEVMERWRVFRAAEPGFTAAVLGRQVHGAEVRWHADPAGWVMLDGVDGHATDRPGVLLCVTVADCTPVYLAAPRHGAVALLHAGWRGTAAGVLARGIALLHGRTGAAPGDLVAHLGVSICGACYEVGREVLEAFGLPAGGPGPWRLDVRDQLARQAQALGVAEVTRSDWCSAHDRDRFYSHRASRGVDGRMVAYLGRPVDATGGGR
ncbi:MAG TPA: polyphenol oxidase family protein [Gemmatimonadales bacterium]|nr:polyphenol oxidase family protein [Gemmatimonadales bacterium]